MLRPLGSGQQPISLPEMTRTNLRPQGSRMKPIYAQDRSALRSEGPPFAGFYRVSAPLTSPKLPSHRIADLHAFALVAAQVLESLGGKLECFYFAFGEDDAIMIYELPDNVAAVRVSIAVNASGLIVSKTTPLLPGEEVDHAGGARDGGSGGPGQAPATRTCAPSRP